MAGSAGTMTIQNGRDLLKLCRQESGNLLRLIDTRNTIAASLLPKGLSIKPVDVMESADADPLADRMAKVIDMDREITRQITALFEYRAMAHSILDHMSRRSYRQILAIYYLEIVDKKPTLDDVADIIGYTGDYTRHLHAEAMREASTVSIENMTHNNTFFCDSLVSGKEGKAGTA